MIRSLKIHQIKKEALEDLSDTHLRNLLIILHNEYHIYCDQFIKKQLPHISANMVLP